MIRAQFRTYYFLNTIMFILGLFKVIWVYSDPQIRVPRVPTNPKSIEFEVVGFSHKKSKKYESKMKLERCDRWKRIAEKLRIIILLHLGQVTLQFGQVKTKQTLVGRVPDLQNQ